MQATISARIDSNDKKRFDHFCADVGLTTSALLNIFVKKVIREQRIPFSIESDPFYSENNVAYLLESMEQLRQGKVITKSLEELEEIANA